MLPLIVRPDCGVPDISVEISRADEPFTEWHLRQEHQLALLRTHMSEESLPSVGECRPLIVQFADRDFHTYQAPDAARDIAMRRGDSFGELESWRVRVTIRTSNRTAWALGAMIVVFAGIAVHMHEARHAHL